MKSYFALIFGVVFAACNFEGSEEVPTEKVPFQLILNANSVYPRPGTDTVALVNDLNQLDSIDKRGELELRDSIQGKIDFKDKSLLLVLTKAHGSFSDSVSIDSILPQSDSLRVFATVHMKDKSPLVMGCSYSAVSIGKREKAHLTLVVQENHIQN